MKDLIIIGGLAPDSVDIDIHSYRTVIAADSGYDTALRLGIRPDVIVGDFDSTSLRAEFIGKGYNPCPADKDETDAELAIMHSSEYDLIGGGEGRIDHTLSLFTVFRRYTPPSIWYMRSDTVVSFSGEVIIEAPDGMPLSIFPLSSSSVFTTGLKWNIKGDELSPLFISLSNRMEGNKATIHSNGKAFIRFNPEDFSSVSISAVPDTQSR